jgi:opacity protein-like surface antigen
MYTQTAVLVGSSALAMAVLSPPAHGQTRWPATGPSMASAVAAAADQPGPRGSADDTWKSPAGDRQVPASVEADRKREAPGARPARINELVYANIEGGYETLSISTLTAAGTLSARDIQPVSVGTSGSGAFYGVGAGFRLAFFTLGGRVRGAHLSAGDLSTINGELGARLVFDRFEPYFTFGAGYAKLSASSGQVAGIPDLDIHGWNARAGLGLDYYPDKNFTLGVNVGSDLLAMARSGVDLSTSPETQARERVKACQAMTGPAQQQCATSIVHDVEGASAGVAGTFAVMMGVHF